MGQSNSLFRVMKSDPEISVFTTLIERCCPDVKSNLDNSNYDPHKVFSVLAPDNKSLLDLLSTQTPGMRIDITNYMDLVDKYMDKDKLGFILKSHIAFTLQPFTSCSPSSGNTKFPSLTLTTNYQPFEFIKSFKSVTTKRDIIADNGVYHIINFVIILNKK